MNIYDLCLQGLVPRYRFWWLIRISGYGPYEFYGTKEEAEYSKDVKAEWEGGRGTLRRAKLSEIRDGLEHLRWQKLKGYVLSDRELEALA